jgi:methionyl-tRNA formyltransferase
VPSLEALLASDLEVSAAVTNPDRPAGRGLGIRPSPVARTAARAGIEVLKPERPSAPEIASRLGELAPDAAVVVAYGRILPGTLLAIPRCGFVNLHFSLLPAYRGAAPVQRAIIDGAKTTGVSVIVLTEKMDEGPLLASDEVPIGEDVTAGELGAELAVRGAVLLTDSVLGYLRGELVPCPQDHAAATYAQKITAEESRIDWSAPAAEIRRLVNALNPAPGAWTTLARERLKLHRIAPAEGAPELDPGELRLGRHLLAGTGDVPIELLEVQLAGRRRMTGADLARGLRLEPGERLA